MIRALHTPEYIALLAAVAIELVGMFTAKTALRSWNWRAARTRQTDPDLNPWLATIVAGIFFLVVLILSLAIELRI